MLEIIFGIIIFTGFVIALVFGISGVQKYQCSFTFIHNFLIEFFDALI